MAERRTGVRRGRRVWWFAAFLAVPTALAGIAMIWPGPRVAADIRERSETALAGAGLTGVTVAVEGRDAWLAQVPSGAERAAASVVAAVPGVRAVHLDTPALPAPMGTVPTATVPTAPIEDAPPAPEAPVLVLFGPDAAALDAPALATVRRTAALLAAAPAARVLVEGHVADTPGGAEAGRQLAERRAAAVADALVAAGVDRSRITARGRGAEQPLGTPARSRRAEISLRYG